MDLRRTTREIQRLVGAKQDGVYGPQTAGRVLAALKHVPHPVNGVVDTEGLDERTVRNLRGLQSGARRKFIPFLRRAMAIGASMGVTVKAICGLRDRAAQEAARRSGASRAGYGHSWHNYGMAVDLGLFKGRSYLDSDDPDLAWTVYNAIGAVAPEYGLKWGGSWTNFIDSPHIQVDLGRSSPSSADRRLLRAGTFRY